MRPTNSGDRSLLSVEVQNRLGRLPADGVRELSSLPEYGRSDCFDRGTGHVALGKASRLGNSSTAHSRALLVLRCSFIVLIRADVMSQLDRNSALHAF